MGARRRWVGARSTPCVAGIALVVLTMCYCRLSSVMEWLGTMISSVAAVTCRPHVSLMRPARADSRIKRPNLLE